MPEVATVTDMVMVPIQDIKPYERNPRRNGATVDKLAELLPRVGFNQPLVLDRHNVIVKGHTRWAAGLKLNMPALPCVYTDADAETIRLDRLADNRVQEYSTWDETLLRSELGALNLPFDFDLGSLDFDFTVPEPEPEPILATTLASPPAGAPETGEPTPGAETAAGAAPVPGAVAEPPLVTMAEPQYVEVICNHCGNHLFVAKEQVAA